MQLPAKETSRGGSQEWHQSTRMGEQTVLSDILRYDPPLQEGYQTNNNEGYFRMF